MAENMSYQQVTPEVIISANLMNKIGIAPDESAGYTVVDKVVLLLKERMTTLDRIHLANHLLAYVYDSLLGDIEEQCGQCDGCTQNCVYQERVSNQGINISKSLRARAGISEDVPLYSEIREDGSIVVRSAEGVPCLENVPEEIREYWSCEGICWSALDALIQAEAAEDDG